MKQQSTRLKRINDLIQKTLASLILQELNDERFRLVTITDVSTARDLSFAKVYVSVLQDDPAKIKDIIQALNETTKLLRHQLAKKINLRIAPDLKFVYDESTAHGFHIAELIDTAMKKVNKEE